MGKGKQVKWPVGAGGQGNAGVAAVIKNVPGGLGYIEQQYATGNNVTFGMVKNADGDFVKATPEGVSKAGEGAAAMMKAPLVTADIWNQKGKAAYPIASFTYIIVYNDLSNLPDSQHAQALVDYLWWTTHEGQKAAAGLSYAPLSESVQKHVDEAFAMLTYKGAPIKPSMK